MVSTSTLRHALTFICLAVFIGAVPVSAADLALGDPVAEESTYAVFPVILTLSSGETAVGINAAITHGNGLTFHDAVASQAALDAGKTLEAHAPEAGTVRIVIYDMANQAIPQGTIAFVRFTVSQAVADGDTVTVSCSRAVAADDSAQGVTISAASSFAGSVSDLGLTATEASDDDSGGCFIGLLAGTAHADEGPSVSAPKAAKAASAPLIIDHSAVDMFDDIPADWLEQAKQLTIHYAHTSHGSQIISGARYLEDNVDSGYNIIVRTSPTEGLPEQENPPGIRMYDGNPFTGASDDDTYITPERYWSSDAGLTGTRAVAVTGNYDLSMWSWCGQQSSNSTSTVEAYLNTMKQLETDYPDMRFILMTGHLGSQNNQYIYSDATRDMLKRNNDLVRDFARDNNMVLFDFADIEGHNGTGYCYENDYHDPYNNLIVECEWPDTPSGCSCAHSVCANCVRKGKAFWTMMARLAGWTGTTAPVTDPEEPDANQVYSVDTDDVTLCVNIILGRSDGSADMNNDGQTDIKDLILMINQMAGN